MCRQGTGEHFGKMETMTRRRLQLLAARARPFSPAVRKIRARARANNRASKRARAGDRASRQAGGQALKTTEHRRARGGRAESAYVSEHASRRGTFSRLFILSGTAAKRHGYAWAAQKWKTLLKKQALRERALFSLFPFRDKSLLRGFVWGRVLPLLPGKLGKWGRGFLVERVRAPGLAPRPLGLANDPAMPRGVGERGFVP